MFDTFGNRGRPESGPAGATRSRGSSSPGEPDGLGRYLQEAGRVPLLDRPGEARLAGELAHSRRVLESLARRMSGNRVREQPWSLEELGHFLDKAPERLKLERSPAAAARTLDRIRKHRRRLEHARDRLILANLRLVVHIAKKFPNNGMPLTDLVQEGNLGLMTAVDRFDHTRGYRFSTYAYWWIRQSIERAIGNQGRTVRLPVHLQEKLRKIRRASERLRIREHREPTTEEIGRESGFSTSKVREALGCAGHVEPLEDADRALDHLRRAADPQAVSPFQHALKGERRLRVEAALKPLTRTERQVIRMRFGLGCERRPTLESIGEAMDISRERVRQIEQQALAKIAEHSDFEELAGHAC